MAGILRATNLTKVYRMSELETTAVANVNLEIAADEFIIVRGPSGSGKSTLLNLLGLLDSPTSGSYVFFGSEVATMPEKRRARLRRGRVGFIFQAFHLVQDMTVQENLELPLLYGGSGRKARQERVSELLEEVQLLHRRNHYPRQLSGGQQQRVAIARAVATHPKLVIADEPTGNLDPEQGTRVIEMLRRLNQAGTAIVMVTHEAEHTRYASRTLFLSDGQLREEPGE